MVKFRRWLMHAFIPPWRWSTFFPVRLLEEIESSITQSEGQHCGEVRFAIENALLPSWVWRGMSGRERAVEVFSDLHVWDTEENCGVLIYVLIADKEVHIIADRGIVKRVIKSEWDAVAQMMQTHFRARHFRDGALQGIQRTTMLLTDYFPADTKTINELPDRPVIIRK